MKLLQRMLLPAFTHGQCKLDRQLRGNLCEARTERNEKKPRSLLLRSCHIWGPHQDRQREISRSCVAYRSRQSSHLVIHLESNVRE